MTKSIARILTRLGRRSQLCIGIALRKYDLTSAEQPFYMALLQNEGATQEEQLESVYSALSWSRISGLTDQIFIGDVRRGIVLSLARQGFFLIPLLVLLPLWLGLDGALYAGPAADTMACLLSLLFVYRSFRKMSA